MSGRFILVDPSLSGFTGHHLQYATHVLRAAAQAGYQPILATNRQLPPEIAPPFATYRQYKYGFWTQPLVSGAAAWLKRTCRLLRRITDGGVGQGRENAGGASQAGQSSVCVLSAANVKAATVAPPMPAGSAAQPRRPLARLFRQGVHCWKRWFADPLRIRQFARDTEHLARELHLGADDLVFLPVTGEIELVGLLRLFSYAEGVGQAKWHLAFRRDPPPLQTSAGSAGLPRRLREAFRQMGSQRRGGNVRFYTDTEELSRQYQDLAAAPFRTLAIPHTTGLPRHHRRPGGPLHILYLGDARTEKGYHHLPGIVQDLWTDYIATGRVVFTIQSNPPLADDDPEIRAARNTLRSLASTAIVVLDEALSPQQYRQLLWSGDLILLLYDPAAYRWRSSGILVEALAAGIPPIAPAGTWLARQFPAADAADNALGTGLPAGPDAAWGPVGSVYTDIRQVPGLIRQMIGQYAQYRTAAEAFAANWVKKHNAANLVHTLSASPEDAAAPIVGVKRPS